MSHGCDAPHADGESESTARAQLVHHAPRPQQSDRVSELEAEDDRRVIALGEREFRLQRTFEQAKYLPVDVVDRRGEEEESADAPSAPSPGQMPCAWMTLLPPSIGY
jgi:hypothetical protein